jgi:hypothetical protein
MALFNFLGGLNEFKKKGDEVSNRSVSVTSRHCWKDAQVKKVKRFTTKGREAGVMKGNNNNNKSLLVSFLFLSPPVKKKKQLQ